MIFELDMSNIELAKKELQSFSSITQLQDNFFRATAPHDKLGMTKAAYEELGTVNELSEIKGSFAARSHTEISDKEFASKIWDDTEGKVDLKNPDNELHLFNGELVAKKVWERKGFEERRSHLKESNHPTSLHPKLARAMINMSKADYTFDPFAGAGGILQEGKLLGMNVMGYDIDPIQCKRANINLGKQIVNCRNSFDEEWPEVIVTDLPYGRNSKIQAEFFTKFFSKVKNCKRAIIGLPSNIELKENPEFSTEIYLHKSLSKRIIILSH